MKSLFNKIYHHTLLGGLVKFVYHFVMNNYMPDKTYTKHVYKKLMGKKLNLKNPQTLNEKINWLKIYDRTPLHTKCADKYKVREFIAGKIGEEYLVPLYFHTKNVLELNPENVTITPCIIKANHDSDGGTFIFNLDDINWVELQHSFNLRLRKNYYHKTREWQYKNIEPRIIVEKLLQDSNGKVPMDYKIHCFNGIVNMIQVDIGRGTTGHCRNWYNADWKREPYRWSSLKENGKFTDPSEEDVPPPKTLKKMIELSEVLSKEFDYVRVDWYDVDGDLYFGELTFHHDGGSKPILPEEWDYELGRRLKLTVSKS